MTTYQMRRLHNVNRNIAKMRIRIVSIAYLIIHTAIVPARVSASSEVTTPSVEYLKSLTHQLEKSHAEVPLPVLNKIYYDLSKGDKQQAEQLLSNYTLFDIEINPESRIKLKPGKVHAELCSGKASRFLVRINNDSGMTAPLRLHSDMESSASNKSLELKLEAASGTNTTPLLNGTPVEYILLRVMCSSPGLYEINLNLDVGQGTQDIGFRSEIPILFRFTFPAKQKLKNATHKIRIKLQNR